MRPPQPLVAAVVVVRRPTHRGRLGRLGLLLLLVELFDGLDLLLELHPPVLEPDLDLALGQAELVRHLYSAPAREVVIRVELLLQLQGLVPGVGLPAAPPQPVGPGEQMRATYERNNNMSNHSANFVNQARSARAACPILRPRGKL